MAIIVETLPDNLRDKKIALVHDFLLYPGGAEQVLETLCEIFPDAPVYTMLHDEENMHGMFDHTVIYTSFLQKFPRFLRKRYRWLLLFLPTAPETFDLRQYDVIISSSGAWSKALVTRLDTTHIAYIHSPMRYVWDKNNSYAKKLGIFTRMFFSYLRVWDFQAAQRPDYLIANSHYTQQRIAKYYRRDAEVIHPGARIVQGLSVGHDKDDSKDSKKHFLVVSRLSAYKNVALAIEVCNKLQLPLIVVGEGHEYRMYCRMAGPTVDVRGWQSDSAIDVFYKSTRAFLFTCADDFGLTMVESLAHGVPVIALRRGGATEIVQEGISGEFFDAPVAEVFADAVRRFLQKEGTYDEQAIKASAQKFSRDVFKQKLIASVSQKM